MVRGFSGVALRTNHNIMMDAGFAMGADDENL